MPLRNGSGKYGFCDKCGLKFSKKDWKQSPLQLCVACRSEDGGKIIELDVLRKKSHYASFGGITKNSLRTSEEGEQNAFDGEDAWQAVARYGTSQTPNEIGALATIVCILIMMRT